jgi:hypothetical protein
VNPAADDDEIVGRGRHAGRVTRPHAEFYLIVDRRGTRRRREHG